MILRFSMIFSLNISSCNSLEYLGREELEYSKPSIIILLLILSSSISLGPFSYLLAKLIHFTHTQNVKSCSNSYALTSTLKSVHMKNALNLLKRTYLSIKKTLKMYTWPIWTLTSRRKNNWNRNSPCINQKKLLSHLKMVWQRQRLFKPKICSLIQGLILTRRTVKEELHKIIKVIFLVNSLITLT